VLKGSASRKQDKLESEVASLGATLSSSTCSEKSSFVCESSSACLCVCVCVCVCVYVCPL
jgi:hypothetical protein